MREKQESKNISRFMGRETHCLIYFSFEMRRFSYGSNTGAIIYFFWQS